MKLQLGLVTRPDIRFARGFFEAYGASVDSLGAGEFVDGIQGQAIEPGFERQPLRLFAGRRFPVPAQRGRDGFVDHFLDGDGIAHHLVGSLAEINLALHEALEAGKIYVDVGTHILGRHRRGKHHGQRVLKRNGNIFPCRRVLLPARPLMRRAQLLFVLVDLLQQVFERGLHGSGGASGRGLRRHLSRRQTQVERNTDPFARRDLFHHAFQVNEFGPENLQPFSQLFYLMVDVFFYGGSFVKTVTDVDVH